MYQKKKLAMLEACKQHGGPFSKPNDIHEFLARCKAENQNESFIKKALKSEVTYARETLTKRPKTDDAFRIRDRTTNKDLTSEQYATNLDSLFSNILAKANVSFDVVRGALQKAVTAAGIEFVSTDSVEIAEAGPSEASPTNIAEPSAAEPSAATCSLQSPVSTPLILNDTPFYINDFIAIGLVNSQGQRSWCLGMIDDEPMPDETKVSFFVPIPGRMGENRVAFYEPMEDALVVPTNSFLPLPPTVNQSLLDSKTVFIVVNHEDLDQVLVELSVSDT